MDVSDSEDRETGIKAMKLYYNHASNIAPSEYRNISFNDFINHIDKIKKSFLRGLGIGIRYNVNDGTFDMDDVDDAMKTFAAHLKGKVPTHLQDFKDYIIAEAKKLDFNFWSNVAEDSLADLVTGAEYVGQNVIVASKSVMSLSKHAKWVLLGGGVIAMLYYGNIFKKVLKR